MGRVRTVKTREDYVKPELIELNLLDESARGWSEPDPPQQPGGDGGDGEGGQPGGGDPDWP